MSFDMLILALFMLIFCFAMQILTIKVMLTLFKANGEEIKPVKIFEKPKKQKISKQQKAEKERFDAIMHNIEVYDGSGRGQIEVE